MAFETSTVVVTGASRGIGRQIALAFARTGRHPILNVARDEKALRNVCKECLSVGASQAELLSIDLADPGSVEAFEWPQQLPEPGILVNNAGIFLLKPLEATSPDEFLYQWKINALAPFLLTHKLLPLMKNNERGLIVNISSAGALTGQPRSGAYSSSKHALLGYTRSLRKELYQTDIAVTAINLGQTMSTSWEGVDVDPDNLIDPVDVADLIVQLTQFSPRTVAEEITLNPQKGDRSPD